MRFFLMVLKPLAVSSQVLCLSREECTLTISPVAAVFLMSKICHLHGEILVLKGSLVLLSRKWVCLLVWEAETWWKPLCSKFSLLFIKCDPPETRKLSFGKASKDYQYH